MRMRYDQQDDALSIRLADGQITRTVQLDPGTLIDLDESGRLLKIEVIRPGRPWPLEQILAEYEVPALAASQLLALWAGQQQQYPFVIHRTAAPVAA